jgi:LPXTG-motif cell wall-anchored protein
VRGGITDGVGDGGQGGGGQGGGGQGGGGQARGGGGRALPRTGNASTAPLAAAGVGLVLIGAFAVTAARRRRTAQAIDS